MNPQIKKGVLDLCILQMVEKSGKIYGYELMKTMREYFPEVNESTFYTVLRRLHSNQYASVITEPSPDGPVRKYYQITKEGEDFLKNSKEEWLKLCDIVNSIITIE